MEESDIYYWKGVAVRMAEQVERAVSPLVGTEEAGEIIKMGADGTPTKLIDLVAEDEAVGVLESTDRPVTIISEEIGVLHINREVDEPGIIFVVDPLDGTSNAIRNIPFYGISVAVAERRPDGTAPTLKNVLMGFVKNFATGDLYWAIKGQGAFLNEKPIRSSSQSSLNRTSLGAFIYGTRFRRVDSICRVIRRMRILGSVALELAYVASGSYDAFMDLRENLRIVDIAASKLIVEEAGGVVTNERGGEIDGLLNVKARTSLVAAGNLELHEKIMQTLEVI